MQTRDYARVLLSWSSGKDSAYALSVLAKRASSEVVGLLTTIDECTRRVPMHSVSEQLLDLQAEALGLQLWKIEIPWPCPNTAYQDALSTVAHRAAREGVSQIAYGDVFLADIRAYREETLRGTGLESNFPLWGLQTADLAAQVIAVGIKATITCVDRLRLDPSFAGVAFDAEFIERLPPGVDPCGENGVFHTLVPDRPGFSNTVPVHVGNIVEEDRFVFADMLTTHFE